MKKFAYIFIWFICLAFLLPCEAQERKADTSTEEVSDAFQEHFFEALMQKGIENYDKAIEKLLLCKELQPNNIAVDFELGKNYFQIRQYAVAQAYLENALKTEPDNLWFLEALLDVYKARGDTYSSLTVENNLRIKSLGLKDNLVKLYTENGAYEQAIRLLDELDAKNGISNTRRNLRIRINALLYEAQKNEVKKEVVIQKDTDNPIQQYANILTQLAKTNDRQALLKVSTEALENYPTQPFFYYSKGLAYNRLTRYKEAVEVLEMALDFLIDDVSIQNNIYKELALAYSSLGNTAKAEQYLQKTKNGL